MTFDWLTAVAFGLTAGANLAAVIGLVFAVKQIQASRLQLRQTNALELIRRLQSDEWTRDIALVRKAVEARTGSGGLIPREFPAAARRVCLVYETIGYLVFCRVLPVEITCELMGPAYHWNELKEQVFKWRGEEPADRAHLTYEWFEWLAQRHYEYRSISRSSAPNEFRSWRPEERHLRKVWPRIEHDALLSPETPAEKPTNGDTSTQPNLLSVSKSKKTRPSSADGGE